MPSIFSNSHKETTSVKHFDIRLEDSNIIFRGSETEAPSAVLKGSVVLCLSEPLQIKGIKLRFTGEKRVAWHQPSSSGTTLIKNDEEFLRRNWDFKRCTETLPAGNYEWPFDMVIPGSTPESLEGLPDSWVIYRMKATIERGVLQQNHIARKQVRIVRSLDPTALELAHTMSVENLWPDKLQYSLSTPMKAVIFGSNICVNFKLIPLLKGLKIGPITTELVEKQDLNIRGPKVMTRSRQVIRKICKDEYNIPEETPVDDIEGQEGFQFSRSLPVPHSLKRCVQTADLSGIKIRHSLMFNVQLNNPDGHISELHATLPVYIFLSPNLPIDENHNLVDHNGRGALAADALSDLTPPQYGDHTFDQLYSEIDTSGYATPGGPMSGISTPSQTRSRSVSGDIVTLGSMASQALPINALPVNALHSRLNRLQTNIPREQSNIAASLESNGSPPLASNMGTRHRQASTAPVEQQPSSDSGEHQNDLSRSTSEGSEEAPSAAQSPSHVEFLAADLAKVPSYTTALKSNPRMPISQGLPSYQTATRDTPLPSPPLRSCAQSLLQTSRQNFARGSI